MDFVDTFHENLFVSVLFRSSFGKKRSSIEFNTSLVLRFYEKKREIPGDFNALYENKCIFAVKEKQHGQSQYFQRNDLGQARKDGHRQRKNRCLCPFLTHPQRPKIGGSAQATGQDATGQCLPETLERFPENCLCGTQGKPKPVPGSHLQFDAHRLR